MNMQLIQYVLEISRCGSISKAAKRLYMSQPALSRALKELETEIGIVIFQRTSTGIVTTHQGQEFLNRAARLNEHYLSLQDIYYNGAVNNASRLSVAAVHYAVADSALIEIIHKYSDCDTYNMHFNQVGIKDTIHHVYDGFYSLGIVLTPNDWCNYWKKKAEQYNLTWQVLKKMMAFVQVGYLHPLAGEKSVKLEQMLEYPKVTMEQNDISSLFPISEMQGKGHSSVKKRIIVNDKYTMYKILTNTEAYYIGANLEKLNPYDGRIKYIPIADSNIALECAILYLKTHVFSKVEKDFINVVKKNLDDIG